MSCLESKVALAMSAGDGVKAGTKYSVIPSSGAGDFDVVRNGINQRINKQLKLENVAVNVPQINWVDGVPVLVTQEADTALIADNVSFGKASWAKSGATIEGNPATAGADLLSGYDFTSGWTPVDATINDDTTFTTTGANGWMRKDYSWASDKMYKLHIAGTIASGGQLNVYDFAIDQNYAGSGGITATTFDEVFYFYATDDGIALRNLGTIGTAIAITTFTVQLVTGYSSPHATYDDVAYRLTATAGNGYINLKTPLTIANTTPHTNSIYVKRVTGTGNVLIKDINNAETVITTTSTWTRFDVTSTSSSTSGQAGIKLATSGDAVDLFLVQSEVTGYVTSPMLNITAGLIDESSAGSRIADVISISAANSTAYDFTTEDFSIAMTFKINALNATSGFVCLYTKGVPGASGSGLDILFANTGAMSFRTHQTGTVNQSTDASTGTFAADTEYNLIITRSGAVAKIYKDGTEVTYSSQGTHIDPSSAAAKNLYLGAYDGDGYKFYGEIKDFQIYNTALTQAQVTALQ